MLKRGRLFKRVSRRKLERHVNAHLVAHKISNEDGAIKFEVAESGLSLLMRNNIMHVEKYSCEQLLCT